MKLLIEDSNACTGEFAIYSLLELYMRQQQSSEHAHGILFIGAAQSFTHYAAVLKKMGLNLQQSVDDGKVIYMDLFSKPYDTNTFDNLPPSQAVPATYSTKLPKKLQF